METLVEDGSFAHEDWYGDEFAERVYRRCHFNDVDLTEAQTRNVVFEECTFGNVRFNASRHAGSAFLRCVFTRCNLFEAEFDGCKVTGSTFHDSPLRPLRVTGGDWSFASLAGADLRGVTFDGVRMREVDLSGANCAGATITGADLSGANLRGADLSRCDLRGSDLTTLDPVGVELRGAVITPEQAVVIAQNIGLEIR
ncbi:pentapeptide repeat-containing protein [Micromonospora sp. CPCC 205371]|nr:pentapeptide repeat-containing protein [Micromonospora sp. CPCC 205371]